MTGRRPADGARHAVLAGRDAGVPAARARRAAAVARARRGDAPQLRGDRRPVAADRHHARAGRRARARGSAPAMPVAVGMRNWQPFIKDAIAELAARRRRRASSASRWRRSSRRSACRSTSTPRRRRCRPASRSSAVQSFHDHPLLLEAFAERVRAAAPARRTKRSSSPRTACRRASSRPAIATPTRSRRPRAASPRAPASRGYDLRVPERRPDAGAVDRPDLGELIDDARRRGRATLSRRARSASCATTRRSCSTSTCRPRAAAREPARRCGGPSRSTRRRRSSRMLEDLVRSRL